ncbi:MAG: hypothetical protein GX663_08955 [Clostridiales bacterium]|nr:hypothetical protein [Clostridiales bacterium]
MSLRYHPPKDEYQYKQLKKNFIKESNKKARPPIIENDNEDIDFKMEYYKLKKQNKKLSIYFYVVSFLGIFSMCAYISTII